MNWNGITLNIVFLAVIGISGAIATGADEVNELFAKDQEDGTSASVEDGDGQVININVNKNEARIFHGKRDKYAESHELKGDESELKKFLGKQVDGNGLDKEISSMVKKAKELSEFKFE